MSGEVAGHQRLTPPEASASTADHDRDPEAGRKTALATLPPVLSGAIAIGTVVALFADWTSTGGEITIVTAVTVAAVVVALPAHRAAVAALKGGTVGPIVASLAVVFAWAATLHAAVAGDDLSAAPAAAVAATLVVIAHRLSSFADRPGVPSPAVAVRTTARDRLVHRWLPVVVGAGALVTAAGWLVVTDVDTARDAGVAALVAASPAAGLLAAPVALLVARGSVRRVGIGLPDPSAVRAAAAADTLLLDLDGTVTTGQLRVISVDAVEADHDRNLRWFAGALAHAGDDPVARAVAQLAGRGRLWNVESDPQQGISGSVDRHPVRLGDTAWLGMPAPESIWTVVGVEVDHRALGTLTVAEAVREDAAEAVEAAPRLGMRLVPLSRLPAACARELSGEAGLVDVHPDATEETASARLRELTSEGARVVCAGPLVATMGAVPDLRESLGLRDLSLRRVVTALRACRVATRAASIAELVAVALGLAGLALAAGGLIGPLFAAGWAASAAGAACGIAAIRAAQT